jgi:hypothetical protein
MRPVELVELHIAFAQNHAFLGSLRYFDKHSLRSVTASVTGTFPLTRKSDLGFVEWDHRDKLTTGVIFR